MDGIFIPSRPMYAWNIMCVGTWMANVTIWWDQTTFDNPRFRILPGARARWPRISQNPVSEAMVALWQHSNLKVLLAMLGSIYISCNTCPSNSWVFSLHYKYTNSSEDLCFGWVSFSNSDLGGGNQRQSYRLYRHTTCTRILNRWLNSQKINFLFC